MNITVVVKAMATKKCFAEGAICTCLHNSKKYYFLVLKILTAYALVVRISKQPQDSQDAKFTIGKRLDYTFKFELENKCGVIKKIELTGTGYCLNAETLAKIRSRYDKEIAMILHQHMTTNKAETVQAKQVNAGKTGEMKFVSHHGIKRTIPSSKKKSHRANKEKNWYRIAPTSVGIKVYHGGRGG